MSAYVINPHRHVKIWFSKDQNTFLNPENQFRLVHLRAKNPQDEISFVYSKELLSDRAQQELLKFCERHHIKPFSLEDDIKPNLISEYETKLMDLAQMELRAAKDHTGGDLAAASDIVRSLPGVYRLGIYSDFDIDIHTANLPDVIFVKRPFITNLGSIKFFDNEQMEQLKSVTTDNQFILVCKALHALEEVSMNNNIIAVPEVNKSLTVEEQQYAQEEQQIFLTEYYKYIIASYNETKAQLIKLVHHIENEVIKNVDNDVFKQLLLILNPDLVSLKLLLEQYGGNNPIEIRHELNNRFKDFNGIVKSSLKKMIEDLPLLATIFQMEEGCSFKEALEEDKVQSLIHFSASILRLTACAAANNNQNVPEYLKNANNLSDHLLLKSHIDFLHFCLYKTSVVFTTGPGMMSQLFKSILTSAEVDEQIAPFSLQSYLQIKESFRSNSNLEFHTSNADFRKLDKMKMGSLSDVSWTAQGHAAVQQREQKMHSAAACIQMWYRKKKHQQLQTADCSPTPLSLSSS